jgi:phage/plasmid-associated DNA primase
MIEVRPEMRATLDEQVPEAEAQELLTKLRAEKAGILNWLLEGREKALKRLGETQ